MSHTVDFKSYYAQCFYLITLFLHDPSHDFLDGKRPIEAYEGSPKGTGPGQRKMIVSHSHGKGGAKMVGGGGAAEEWEQVQEVMTPIYAHWMQQGAPGAAAAAAALNLVNQAPKGGMTPLQLIWMLKSQSHMPGDDEELPLSVRLAREAVVSPPIQQILQNYLLTYDTIDNLHGNFFIDNQLFQRIGTHTQGNLSCQLGNTCLVDMDSIKVTLNNVPAKKFVPYNGIVASNGNFFLPMKNSMQVARVMDVIGNVAVLIRIDLTVQRVPMVTNPIQPHLEMVKTQMAQQQQLQMQEAQARQLPQQQLVALQQLQQEQMHQHLQALEQRLLHHPTTPGYWNIIISNDGTTVTQGFEKKGGQPGDIPEPHVLSSQSAEQWFQMQFGFAMNCGVQALLSTWLRVGIALEQIQKAVLFTRDRERVAEHVATTATTAATAAAARAAAATAAAAVNPIYNEGLDNLRDSTNYYTNCVVNDECGGDVQGGGGTMSGGMSWQTEEKVKIAYSWYMAVALNSVYFPLQKTIPEGSPRTIESQIEIQKLLMNQSLKIILPLVTMGQKGKTIRMGKGAIDKKLLEKFKQIVCSCRSEGTCNYGGVLLEAKPLNDLVNDNECVQRVPRSSKPGQTKLILGAAGQPEPFLHLLGQKNCNKAPCGDVGARDAVGARVSAYFTTQAQQNKKFLINNALSTKSTYISKAIKFCPESSIFDPMSMCSSGTIQSDGIEIGNMDVTIRHQNLETGEIVAGYRIQVTVNDGNQSANMGAAGWDFANVGFNIVANLQIGKERLLNNLTIPIPASDSWGKGGIFGAANVLMELGQIVDTLNAKFTGGKKNLRNLYNWVGTDGANQATARSAIVGVLFKKGLGDNLQELNGVITNGGYVSDYKWLAPRPYSILPPDQGRMMLGTDQPSAVRAMFLVMMGQGAINNNAVAGYVGADGHYILAARTNFGTAGGGGGGRRKKIYKRRRRSRKRKGKTKKYKKKKYVKTLKGRKYKKKSRRKR